MNDLELLAEYTRNRSDEAFAAIVERYIRLVHSACWRQMGDAQLAEDATQMVFVLLSRKAASLRHAELAGWLLTFRRPIFGTTHQHSKPQPKPFPAIADPSTLRGQWQPKHKRPAPSVRAFALFSFFSAPAKTAHSPRRAGS